MATQSVGEKLALRLQAEGYEIYRDPRPGSRGWRVKLRLLGSAAKHEWAQIFLRHFGESFHQLACGCCNERSAYLRTTPLPIAPFGEPRSFRGYTGPRRGYCHRRFY